MIALLLETSGKQGFVALGEGGEILAHRSLDEGRRHARDLVPMVGEILGERGLTPREVGVVAVSQGPGSYTGLRVGIASALAFRFATDCHLLLVPSFGIWAKGVVDNIPGKRMPIESPIAGFDVLGDALKGWVYHQRFCGEGIPTGDLGLCPVKDWAAMNPADLPVAIAPGVNLDLPLDAVGHQGKRYPGINSPAAFQAIVAGRIAKEDWNDSDIGEPLYLRPSSAELQMIERSKGGG